MGLCGCKKLPDEAYKHKDEEAQSGSTCSGAAAGGHIDSDGLRISDGTMVSEGSGGWGPGESFSVGALFSDTHIRRMRLITDTWGSVSDHYVMDTAKLGQGAFGSVCKGTSKDSNLTCAIKSMSKMAKKDMKRRYRQEISIMRMLDHPNIVKLFETFEDKQHIFLVMELCAGGDLFQRLASVGMFPERESVLLMSQILRPVCYLHEKHICHRDLKPENFLFLSMGPVADNCLKLIDFGFACMVKEGQALSTKLGTARYSSPQVLEGNYDKACDLWSCGVIMYILLSGQFPFEGKSDAEVMRNIKRGNYAFKGPTWSAVSDDGKDLIRTMLKYQAQERTTADQALQFLSTKGMVPEAELAGALLTPSLLMDIRSFCAQSLLRRAALQIVAQQLSQEDSYTFRRAFTALDSKGIGVLSINEMKASLGKHQNLQCEVMQVVNELQTDENTEIGFTDFLAATLDSQHYAKEGACRAAFRAFDRNSDGVITLMELQEVLFGTGGNDGSLKAGANAADIQAILRSVDANGDGVIDFQEFRSMLCGQRF